MWCDLTRLLGGEDFWWDIEVALRDGTVKFLYVLSRESNQKPGPLQELSVALAVARQKGLKDFVIPLRIDDLPFQEINIQLNRLNAIDFSHSWAVGMGRLVEKLELDGVQQDPRFSPSSVADWWSTGGAPGRSVVRAPEVYWSNWFEIEALPEVVYLHSVPPFVKQSDFWGLLFPVWKVGDLAVSFANADDVNKGLVSGAHIGDSYKVDVHSFLNGLDGRISIKDQDARRALVGLLRQGWREFVHSLGMSVHRLSNGVPAFYLPDGLVERNRVGVPREGRRPSWRQLVGSRSRGRSVGGDDLRRYWHFAVDVQVSMDPLLVYKLVPHILFSNDGKTILDDGYVQRYRRREGSGWWNADWRDRTLGLMSLLTGGDDHVVVPLGPGVSARVSSSPVRFASPVSYETPSKEC